MGQAIELHDSEVLSLEPEGHGLVLEMRVYLHISNGVPGVDRGTGWSQHATLALDGSDVITSATAPFEILEGVLVAGEHDFDNLVPLPFDAVEAVRFEVVGSNRRRLSVRADSASICLEGDPTYIEDFEP
jgi:hypothetical protein